MLHDVEIFSIALALIHLLGAICAVDALFWSRSPQGALAWGIFLVSFPYLALPLYVVLGSRRLRGYRRKTVKFIREHGKEFAQRKKHFSPAASVPPNERPEGSAFEAIAGSKFSSGNRVELLIDGTATFDAINAAIEKAEKYILVEFYTICDGAVCRAFKEKLEAAVRRGVTAYLLYDAVGSQDIPQSFIDELRTIGVHVASFGSSPGFGKFHQLNFRNHRKVVVVDGTTAFIGGLNLADEYLGNCSKYKYWRDTHIRIQGPELSSIQSAFFSDWYWATQQALEIEWITAGPVGECDALTVSTGPIDEQERCSLFFVEAIRTAKERIWLSSPYFVPDEAVIRALQLAALRGVDVRLLLPENPDHYLVWLASFSYIPPIRACGCRVFRYQKGFLHQKAFLVDRNLAAVGTANLDNRSFRLNFEITLLVANSDFNRRVEEMFERDLKESHEDLLVKFESLPLQRQLLSKFARLFAPIL
jgi:cardiolipin synthase